jgi:wyosine [tRNA(Phe)-imidazoG37] synthetase (radical SAM superfamily)
MITKILMPYLYKDLNKVLPVISMKILYHCVYCQVVFGSLVQLVSHSTEKHGDKELKWEKSIGNSVERSCWPGIIPDQVMASGGQ